MSRNTKHDDRVAQQASVTSMTTPRMLMFAAIVLLALFGSYRFAVARSATPTSTIASATATPASVATGAAGSNTAPSTSGRSFQGSGCACCGGSRSAKTVKASAKVSGAAQSVTVDTSTGSYSPNTITLKAGVPARITFKQASGCLGQVVSSDLGFSEDLTTGDKTVQLPALKAGKYSFNCGMQMVFGTIVVK